MPKLLVIDKNIFHWTSVNTEFVKSHRVILPHALGVECIISDDECGRKPLKNPNKLLEKLVILIKAGAFIGHSPHVIIKREGETKKAIDCIIDYQNTEYVRETKINIDGIPIKSEAEEAKKAFQPMIDFCKTMAMTYYGNLVKKNLQESFRQVSSQTELEGRLRMWINAADKLRERILCNQMPSINAYVTESNDRWFSWQLLRIYFTWAIEWASKRNQSGPSFEKDKSNDFYDMEYVVCLNNADGILANDKLVSCLARVAFPEKDVFSCLDEVTDDYRC